LCVATFGVPGRVAAQNGNGADRVLFAGRQALRQSEVDRLIEFYEWAFGTRFSADERARYQAFVVEGFRQDAVESRKATDTLISALAKILTKDEATQQKMRQSFNEDFGEKLRATNDEESRLLLGIYERGLSGGGQEKSAEDTSVAGVGPGTSGNGAGSPNLVGQWVRSTGAGRGDDGTGKTTYSSGTNYTFEFFADGTMQFLVEKKVLSITQCRISEITKIPGRYPVSGDDLTMNLGEGTSIGTSSCEAKDNFKKTLSSSVLSKKFVVKKLQSVFRPDQPLMLCFDDSADDGCFERAAKRSNEED
jgi:hypothetical protein